MKLSNKTYCITIDRIDYPMRFEELKTCDYVYNPDNYNEDDLCSAFLIHVETKSSKVLIGLIGSCYGIPDHCAVLEDSELIVLMNAVIVIFDLETISIQRYQSIGNETYFSLYSINDGFLVHGELSILRLNRDLQCMWDFRGSDIWAIPDSTREAFSIVDDKILLEDWLGNKYMLNMDGQLVAEIRSSIHLEDLK